MASTSNGWSFGYDANGNMNAYKGSSISWYSYNLPNVINSAGQASQFFYRPNRNRWKQVATYPSGTETTIYVGGILEKVTAPSGTAYRHTIGAGSAKVLYTRWSTGTITTKYVTADHLGSSTLVMNDSGGTLVNLSFGSYGARRGSHWTGSPSSGDWSQIANSTRRGFTGHEHLDNVNFVHMNGRVYEPVLGRFISADPFMPASLGSQAPNRYAYVGNRPQSLVDPSGFQDRDVTEVLSGPRIFPQCRYQMPDISNDCPFQYGWRWDRDPFDLWLLQEEKVEAWVRYMLATADTRPRPAPKPAPNPPLRPVPAPEPESTPPDVLQEGDFHYRIQDFAFCSADELFAQFSEPDGSAPGAPAAVLGTTPDIVLAGGNPITQIVNGNARTITNVTQERHRYHSGTVEIRVTPARYGSAVSIEGRGTGPRYWENKFLGSALFLALATKATISCTVGAD